MENTPQDFETTLENTPQSFFVGVRVQQNSPAEKTIVAYPWSLADKHFDGTVTYYFYRLGFSEPLPEYGIIDNRTRATNALWEKVVYGKKEK